MRIYYLLMRKVCEFWHNNQDNTISMSEVKEQTGSQVVVSNILQNRILKFSEDKRMSQIAAKQALADYLGVKVINVTRWVRNNAQPTLPQAIEIAKFLSLKVEDVFITHKS